MKKSLFFNKLLLNELLYYTNSTFSANTYKNSLKFIDYGGNSLKPSYSFPALTN